MLPIAGIDRPRGESPPSRSRAGRMPAAASVAAALLAGAAGTAASAATPPAALGALAVGEDEPSVAVPTRRGGPPATDRPGRPGSELVEDAGGSAADASEESSDASSGEAGGDGPAPLTGPGGRPPAAAPGTDAAAAVARPVHFAAFDACLRLDPETGAARLDAACAFDLLQRRYRAFVEHRESGRLIEAIDVGSGAVRRTETDVDCLVRDGRFEVQTTARRIRGILGRMIPIRTGPGVERARDEIDRWMVPHAMLEPGADAGLAVTSAGPARHEERDVIRLELEGGGDRVELFVDPERVVVEHARSERALPDGGRWSGRLHLDVVGELEPLPSDLVPERGPAVHADDEAGRPPRRGGGPVLEPAAPAAEPDRAAPADEPGEAAPPEADGGLRPPTTG